MIQPRDLTWVQKKYLKIGQTSQYEFEMAMYKPLADWDVYDNWEKERTRSLVKHLNKGDILFDIGAETGWLSVIYGQIVGPSNMVLIEPTGQFWGNIKALWLKNFDCPPLACHHGLFSDKTTDKTVLDLNTFPKASRQGVIEKLAYTYIGDKQGVSEITLDDYVKQSGVVPNAITVDVEGAELLVLRGGENTLRDKNVMVWVSEHDDLAENYAVKPNEVSDFMYKLGYSREVLSTDHERHVRYYK